MDEQKKRLNVLRKLPVLKGFVDEGGNPTINVWCPYCKKFHIHGWPKEPKAKKGLQHRTAHCGFDSPFRKAGYIVKPFTKRELKC